MKKDKNIAIMNFEEFEKEETEIYPEGDASKLCDTKIDELCKINNWTEMFYHGKTKLMKERFLNIISKSECSKFFEGLNHEYGINDKQKDLKLAFKIYKEQADNSTDALSMFRMYHIYKNDFKNFGFEKRNKILEKYYLFKCYCYLTKDKMESYSFLFNKFYVSKVLKIHFLYEDNNQKKFDKLMKHLNKYIFYYNIKKDDLSLMESIIAINFKNNENNKENSLELLKTLAKENNLESIYKLAIFEEKDEVENYFIILEKNNYYRAFCDYALFLLKEKNNIEKALELLIIAINNGVLEANFLYYSIFLYSLDFSKIEANKKFKDSIIFIFNLLIIFINKYIRICIKQKESLN